MSVVHDISKTILVNCAIKYNLCVCFFNLHSYEQKKESGGSESLSCAFTHHDALGDPHSSASMHSSVASSQRAI